MMLHFERLLESCGVRGWHDGHQTLTIDRTGFARLLRGLLSEDGFDERWYVEAYPDVRDALERSEIGSAWEHYVEFGYFEGRLPGLAGFDHDAYLGRYDDLAPLLGLPDRRAAAIDHFLTYGYREGRSAARARRTETAGE